MELAAPLACPCLPAAPHADGLSLSLQDEEEEDIDNLVEIHRQRVARGSMRSGTSSVSPAAWLRSIKWRSSQLFPREPAC